MKKLLSLKQRSCMVEPANKKIQKFYRPLDLSRENVNLFPPV